MNPDLMQAIAAERTAELRRDAEQRRLARAARRARAAREPSPHAARAQVVSGGDVCACATEA